MARMKRGTALSKHKTLQQNGNDKFLADVNYDLTVFLSGKTKLIMKREMLPVIKIMVTMMMRRMLVVVVHSRR